MNICLAYRTDVSSGRLVDCYASSVARELRALGHNLLEVGEGHPISSLEDLDPYSFDFLLEIENGRNDKGDLFFQQGKYMWRIPSAVWLIDSHGQPDLHKAVSKRYSHVFFAVWNRRDLYAEHKSAHWCPNSTDLKWFGYENFKDVSVIHDFGFFGSKTGIDRADGLRDACVKNNWSFDIRQVTKPRRHKWPSCGRAMSGCKILFNKGQKHDGPNQRVLESMAVFRPLLCDRDPKSGLEKLFVEGRHFIGYNHDESDLEEKCKWIVDNYDKSLAIADEAYFEASTKHTIANRVNQILETLKGGLK